jgi:YegS/Rv2252/BmrU family lipid kinase
VPDNPRPWLAIVNPASGPARGRSSWPDIDRALRDAGVSFTVEQTTRPRDGEELARRAVLAGRRRLLVAGGDGSVHDVVNGIMNADPSVHESTLLAVAPLGTGNDWARSLGMHLAPRDLAAAISAAHTVRHDVGAIDFPDQSPPRRRWFINVAGAGFDAHVIARLPVNVPSTLAYLRGALVGLATYRSPRFTIRAGDLTIDQRLLLAFVANAQSCGNGMRVAPTAQTDDGLLDLVAIDAIGLLRALPKIAKLYRGTLLGDPVVRHARAERVRLDASPATEIEADGQIVGRTPAEFSVVARALGVVVPPRPS